MSRGNNSSQQLALQQRSLELQEQQGAQNVAFLEAQLAALRKTQVADYKQLAPPPTPGTSGSDYAAAQELLTNQRRFNFSDTVRGGVRYGLGRSAAA